MSIRPYKFRSILTPAPVFVYRNLAVRTETVFSVMQNGLVVAHGCNFSLYDVTPRIRQSGAEEYRRTGTKNVHAFLCGYIRDGLWQTDAYKRLGRVSYKCGEFLIDGNPMTGADLVEFTDRGVFAWIKET